MSNSDDDAKLEELAESLRASADTPEAKAFVEDAIARIERSPAYYAALGQFVSSFSRVETTLQYALWAAARVHRPLGPAIFSGYKIEGCLQLMKRIADAKDWEPSQKEMLEEITNRLGPLNRLRNDILHFGTSIDFNAEDSWFWSNRDFVHIPEKIREFSITPAVLDDASSDLSKLFGLIILLSVTDLAGSERGASIRPLLDPLLARAWLY